MLPPRPGSGLFLAWEDATSLPRHVRTGSVCALSVFVTALAACKDGATNIEPQSNPVPVIASLSQSEALAGSPGFVLTVSGSGFVASSEVLVAAQPRAAVSVGPAAIRVTLTDADLTTATTFSVAVRNPSPGGGTSNAVDFHVLNPVPAVTSLSQSEAVAGSPGFMLTVNGSGFNGSSVVLIGSDARPPVNGDPTAVQVMLVDTDLAKTGSLTVAVRNPPPGGGTSNALEVRLLNPRPEIKGIPSSGATAGGPGFTMSVHGTNFAEGAVVFWNGEARSTERVDASRLRATISSSDVAVPGVVTVHVENPPPGGGPSGSVPLTVRVVGSAVATAVNRVQLAARDLLSDRARGVLYASIPTNDPVYGNQVIRIDPATGGVAGATFVGSEPGRLAMSQDGSYLYVGLDGAFAIRRVALSTFTPDLQWSLPAGETAGDIEVIPGSPRTVAVSRHSPGSPSLRGVTVFDDGIARTQSAPGHTGGARIVTLDSPDYFFGFNMGVPGSFFTIGVSKDGASHLLETRGVISGYYADIVGAAGRVYGTDGSIVDPEFHQRVASVGSGHAVLPDPATGRLFVLSDAGVLVHDMNTLIPLATIPVSGFSMSHPANRYPTLVRWGDDGLAFLDADELFLVRSPIIRR